MARDYTPVTHEIAAYVRETAVREPEALKRLREETEGHPLAHFRIAPEQGRFLHLFAFIDAGKSNYLAYYERAFALLRPRGLIAADNVLYHGRMPGPDDRDPDTEAIRVFNRRLRQDARVCLSIGAMGDGLMLAHIL